MTLFYWIQLTYIKIGGVKYICIVGQGRINRQFFLTNRH
ncbi:hypothetical protein XSR1_120042 [Xenorhabdus szentirmaii DSM 16338]|uniref:Uncharacterized protein n=1 Tax=Xenorhabdus szentirmaii DSM 16338 TaxID=1427518 RepID=W1IS47_9GAMM|nr:hypothetical protein XSR1_120042 [Xenorhabdus szentirmaii DSM 16338]